MNISYRLKVISSFINEDSIVVDIGCDHALLPIYLVKENKTKIVYAVDNKIGPLNRATLNIEANNLTDFIIPILSDGFKNLTDLKYDTVVIAGMGGILIKDILDFSLIKNNPLLILEPNNDSNIVRCHLMNNGYEIIDEAFIKCKGHFYPIIVGIKSNSIIKYSQPELEYGPKILKNKPKEFIEYIEKKINILTEAKNKAKSKESIINEIKQLEEIIK